MSGLPDRDDRREFSLLRRRMLQSLREGWRPLSPAAARARLPGALADFYADEDSQFDDPDRRGFYAALNDDPELEEDFAVALAAARVPASAVPANLLERLLALVPGAPAAAPPRNAIAVFEALAAYLRRNVDDVRTALGAGRFVDLARATRVARQQLHPSGALRRVSGRETELIFERMSALPGVAVQFVLVHDRSGRWRVECEIVQATATGVLWPPRPAEQICRLVAATGGRHLDVREVVPQSFRIEAPLTLEELAQLAIEPVPVEPMPIGQAGMANG